jgi:hypothetical protein
MIERRSASRRRRADRRIVERRSYTLRGPVGLRRADLRGLKERRTGLRRLEYRRRLANRRGQA